MTDATFWLLITLFWTIVLSFYSMQEMACISCNKLRLDFAVSQKKRWAIWLHELITQPQKLFTTTLVGVNVAMMLSSESSRQLFEAWGLDPNLAPLAEIPLLVVVGELIPMFAARLYPDHASRLGIPLLYASAKILTPITACISYFVRKKEEKDNAPFLSRDELQKLLEEHQAGYLGEETAPEADTISNIFTLQGMRAFQLMRRLDQVVSVSTHTTANELRAMMKKTNQSFFPVYHKVKNKIIGMVYVHALLNVKGTKRVEEYAESCVFIAPGLSAIEAIQKLQSEGQSAAVVITAKGEAKGLVYLSDLIEELFGSETKKETADRGYLEKTIGADTLIRDFNDTYDTEIDPQDCKTFAELIEKSLTRHPHVGDTLILDAFEITVKETSLFKAKTIQIRSK